MVGLNIVKQCVMVGKKERPNGEKGSSEQPPDQRKLEALRKLPAEIVQSLSREEIKAFLYSDEWPDSLQEKLKDYLVD